MTELFISFLNNCVKMTAAQEGEWKDFAPLLFEFKKFLNKAF